MGKLAGGATAVPRGRHGLSPKVIAAHQRQRILEATIELVAKRGYRGTSVDQIVKSARVGYAAFYELFDGKEDCFCAAFDLLVAETRQQIAAAIPPEAAWPQRIAIGLRAITELIAADPSRARVALVEAQAAGPVSYARYQAALDGAIPVLRLGRGLAAPGTALSDTLEEAIVGGIAWVFHQRLVRGEAATIVDLAPETILTALGPYLGESEARRIVAANTSARQALGAFIG